MGQTINLLQFRHLHFPIKIWSLAKRSGCSLCLFMSTSQKRIAQVPVQHSDISRQCKFVNLLEINEKQLKSTSELHGHLLTTNWQIYITLLMSLCCTVHRDFCRLLYTCVLRCKVKHHIHELGWLQQLTSQSSEKYRMSFSDRPIIH